MPEEKKTVELEDEELEKVSGGQEETEEESVITKAYTGNLLNSLFVDCPFCKVNKQFITNTTWEKSNSFLLNCGCKLEKMGMMSVKITKHQN